MPPGLAGACEHSPSSSSRDRTTRTRSRPAVVPQVMVEGCGGLGGRCLSRSCSLSLSLSVSVSVSHSLPTSMVQMNTWTRTEPNRIEPSPLLPPPLVRPAWKWTHSPSRTACPGPEQRGHQDCQRGCRARLSAGVEDPLHARGHLKKTRSTH